MSPDLNSVPDSPHLQRARLSQPSSSMSSRRTSQVIHSHAISPTLQQGATASHSEQSAMPLRHPRPMTAAELHMELEKEQEAIVNRLTRELSTLRAQHSASVVSNASMNSSSSAAPSLLPVDPADPNPAHQIVGPTHPTPSRRHRSSSNASAMSGRSSSAALPGASTTGTAAASVPHPGQSQASADRAAAITRTSLSRNPSVSASGTSTPARQSVSEHHLPVSTLPLPHRPSLSQATSFTSQNTSSTHATLGSVVSPAQPHQPPTQTMSSPHHAPLQYGIDADRARVELETVKLENEALKDRVRILERALRSRRRTSNTSDISSVSGLTPAANLPVRGGPSEAAAAPVAGVSVSAWAAGTVESPLEAPTDPHVDDPIKVGESAGNSGLA